MVRVGLLSDTHGFLDPKILIHFNDCDEIWHAGDFGTKEISDQLSSSKVLRGVYGNIDGRDIRNIHPLEYFFEIEGFRIFILHIGGYPNHYPKEVKILLEKYQPDIFVCGHSHILRINKDEMFKGMLVLNPGAAGKHGFHKVRTLIKFDLNQKKIENMKVIELGKRA